MAQVSSIEVGMSRALAPMLSKKAKRLPDLPSFDDVTDESEPAQLSGSSEFRERFEYANRLGRYTNYDPNAIEEQDIKDVFWQH